ncbi:MAG: hypothetical protein RLZ98_3392 [Pseudomonadota bacterium]|jgi:hypothetical protein
MVKRNPSNGALGALRQQLADLVSERMFCSSRINELALKGEVSSELQGFVHQVEKLNAAVVAVAVAVANEIQETEAAEA